MRKLIEYCAQHREVAVVTFELFWIVVFLLEAVTGGAGAEVSGFVYANF
jgi:hypothetical protein